MVRRATATQSAVAEVARLLGCSSARADKWQEAVPVDPQHSLRLHGRYRVQVVACFTPSPKRNLIISTVFLFSRVLKFIDKKLGRSSIGKLMSLVEYTAVRIKRQINRNALYAGNMGMQRVYVCKVLRAGVFSRQVPPFFHRFLRNAFRILERTRWCSRRYEPLQYSCCSSSILMLRQLILLHRLRYSRDFYLITFTFEKFEKFSRDFILNITPVFGHHCVRQLK